MRTNVRACEQSLWAQLQTRHAVRLQRGRPLAWRRFREEGRRRMLFFLTMLMLFMLLSFLLLSLLFAVIGVRASLNDSMTSSTVRLCLPRSSSMLATARTRAGVHFIEHRPRGQAKGQAGVGGGLCARQRKSKCQCPKLRNSPLPLDGGCRKARMQAGRHPDGQA